MIYTGVQLYTHNCITTSIIKIWNISFILKISPCFFVVHFPHLWPLATADPFSVIILPFPECPITEMSYSMWPFESGFFPLSIVLHWFLWVVSCARSPFLSLWSSSRYMDVPQLAHSLTSWWTFPMFPVFGNSE